MESRARKILNRHPATKLFLKSLLDLFRGDLFQARNAMLASGITLLCGIKRSFRNRNLVECNYCGWTGNEFYPHHTRAMNAVNQICPRCHSIPRYRLLYYFLSEQLDFFSRQLKILEIGPNRSLQHICLQNPDFDYLSVDLMSPQAMRKMDLTDLKFDDGIFDVVICVSVLQFVKDDHRALEEIYRVLKPGGYAIVASGIDESLQRTMEFSQPSKEYCYVLRTYGSDAKEKFESVGFRAIKHYPYSELSQKDIQRFRMSNNVILQLLKNHGQKYHHHD